MQRVKTAVRRAMIRLTGFDPGVGLQCILVGVLLPFSLIGLVLRPVEWLLKVVFSPVERVLPAALKGDQGFVGTVKTMLYAVIIALAVRTFAYEPFNIPSGSMKPTLLVGDYLFVSKFSYGYSDYSLGFGTDLGILDERLFDGEPQRGDVVVFRQPTNTSVDFIKRLVGLPGDRIRMIDGVLHVNGMAVILETDSVFEDRSCSASRAIERQTEVLPNGARHSVLNITDNGRLDTTPEYTVPHDHYFMLGDNRDSSNDSRVTHVVGFVPKENLIGRAEFLFFSTNGCGSLFNPLSWPASIRWDRLFRAIS